ncbi:MAG: Bifunctional protein PaaZ [Syntrophaceae bacterium PtaB.Bin095]|nr:MAG: Bifunctional protein PaaZ [Syntrophaceae bacterium PtaB.Bin095]
MEKLFFEDYAVGEAFKSPARTMTETDIVLFASLTGDWHPIHTNVEYAKKAFFGERIAHGMLTLCVGSALIFRLGPFVALPKSFIAFYGMDSVRFTGPVKIGDTIHCVVQVEKLEAKDDRTGVIVSKNFIRNQRDEDVVVYTTRALVGRKPKA